MRLFSFYPQASDVGGNAEFGPGYCAVFSLLTVRLVTPQHLEFLLKRRKFLKHVNISWVSRLQITPDVVMWYGADELLIDATFYVFLYSR
jgi:hypothetical protein